MNDIYEYKAKKYKYKYLKLKREYIGGGGSPYIQEFHRFCEKSPPQEFVSSEIKQIYPENKVDLTEFNSIEYVGKFVTDKDNNIQKEIDIFKNIEKYDKNNICTSKLVYAGKISKGLYEKFLSFIKMNTGDKMKKLITKDINYNICEVLNHKNDDYGYIISTNVGTTFNKIYTLTPLGMDSKETFLEEKRILVEIFKKLKEAIDTFITKLNNEGYILGNINIKNITLGQDNKIYFINYSTMFNLNEKEKIKNNIYSKYGKTDYYQKILKYFFEIEKDARNDNINMITISYLINFIARQTKSLPEVIEFIIPEKYLQDINKEYSIDEIYENIFIPIIKKIDINALCRFIYILYYKFITQSQQTNETYKKMVQLIGFNLYSTIENHAELSNLLNDVIITLEPKINLNS
jgi:hypothetical protein